LSFTVFVLDTSLKLPLTVGYGESGDANEMMSKLHTFREISNYTTVTKDQRKKKKAAPATIVMAIT